MLGLENVLADSDPFGVVLACVFLLIAGAAGAYLVIWLRRRLRSSDEFDSPGVGFTLGDLRQLHRDGKISDAEFQHVRNKVVSAAQEAAQRQSTKEPPAQSSA